MNSIQAVKNKKSRRSSFNIYISSDGRTQTGLHSSNLDRNFGKVFIKEELIGSVLSIEDIEATFTQGDHLR